MGSTAKRIARASFIRLGAMYNYSQREDKGVANAERV